MKKIYLTIAAAVFACCTYAQTNTFPGSGSVGIGTTSPLTLLDVKLTTNQHVQFVSNVNGAYSGASGIVCINDGNTAYTALGFYASNYYFGGGDVAIGTTNPQGYKLAVDGPAIATSMTVKAYTSWPDYVFKKTYKLPPLTETAAYIDKNHHLPEMPSGQQIAKDSLNLGEMNKLLVKKVEELTLYLIENEKQNKAQQQKLLDQEQRIKLLEVKLDQLLKKTN